MDIYSLFQNSEYLPNALDPHPSSLGYKKISDLIINELGDELWIITGYLAMYLNGCL